MSSNGVRIWYQSFTDPEVDSPYFGRLRDYVTALAPPGTTVDVHGLRPGDRYLHPLSEFRCAAQVLGNALTAQQQGYDAFVIGHFQEPGLQEARASVDIPVVGLGEATMLFACSLGRTVGLVTINPVFIPYHEDQITRYRLQDRIVAVRAVHGQVADYNRAFDDDAVYERMKADFCDQVRPLLERGIDVVVPAGGYPMLLFAREPGFCVDGATVLKGLPVVLEWAGAAIRLRSLNGTSVSRRSTYALPPAQAIEEFQHLGLGRQPGIPLSDTSP